LAVIPKPENHASFDIFELGEDQPLPPAGSYIATCVDIKDVFEVTRTKFKSEETEKVDLTYFLFNFTHGGVEYRINSNTNGMKISGYETSNLVKFLNNWMGVAPPTGTDWDYAVELLNQKAMISISHEEKTDGRIWAKLRTIAPVPAAEEATVPVTSDSADDELGF